GFIEKRRLEADGGRPGGQISRILTLPEQQRRHTVGPVQGYEMLAAAERLPARPFTDPERTTADAAVMDRMLQRLRREARSWPRGQTSAEVLRHTRGCRDWLV